MKKAWTPHSWQTKNASQQPQYPDAQAVKTVQASLQTLPPLVTHFEVQQLKGQLAEAQQGRRFILQGGDCAENFAHCQADKINNKVKILLQMSLILLYGLRQPITRIGRIAGQFAKPRSSEWETKDGMKLPSYRGDLINGQAFTPEARTPNPKLMLKGYQRSALTLNYIRALMAGGFADLHHPECWQLDFVKHSPTADKYLQLANRIRDSLDFLSVIPGMEQAELNRVDFFTSHEALHLIYEESLTRYVEDKPYNLSTHLPWIGMRTAQLDDAHVEYMRGIANPIGIKVGPSMTAEWLRALMETLNPDNEAGRLVLIHRFGATHIEEYLPPLIDAAKKSGIGHLWMSDPMHGNTHTTKNGIKTRRFSAILAELRHSFEIHRQQKSHLSGVHFELTGENVTECIGGTSGLTEADLQHAYESLVDPRLNYEQALEMAMLIVQGEARPKARN